MATGSLVGGVCYDTLSLATDAYFSGLPVLSVLSANGVVLTTSHFKDVAGDWNVKQVSTDAVGVQSIVYQVVEFAPPFSSCYSPSESFADGIDIGWIIAAMCVAVLFVKVAKKIMDALYV